MTVTGLLAASALGPTLAHEHVWCDVSLHSGRPDNRVMDEDRAVGEMAIFRAAGGGAIIEVTPDGIGRDLAALQRISARSGVPIVGGVAFYDKTVYPTWVRDADAERLAEYFIESLTVGAAFGGARAGIIGELTSHNEPVPNMLGYRLEPIEQVVFQGAALAQRRTGAGITTLASLGRGGLAQLDVLESACADLGRVAIGHCDAHRHDDIELDLVYCREIIRRGAFCQYDLIGWTQLSSDDDRADRLAALIREGHARQLLLATDTCRQSQLRACGGRGYGFLFETFLPRLRARGVSEAQIRIMLVDNPRRLLCGA